MEKEALYYRHHSVENGTLECLLCPHACIIPKGAHGKCHVRANIDGQKLAVENYAQISSMAIDPVEKKPLYHFYPGSKVFSIGTWGCNLSCQFCQNWQLSFEHPACKMLDPQSMLRMVLACKENDSACRSIAYTYSEPTVWYEYLIDTAPTMQAAGIKTILVSNGYINKEPLLGLTRCVDAANIDVKGFKNDYYRKTCGGSLLPVLKTVETLHDAGCHVEITMLLIPGLNDDNASITAFAGWAARIDSEIPVHFTRYFPCYNMSIPATPVQTLLNARCIAKEKLCNVYVGNADVSEARETFCKNCGKMILSRSSLPKIESHIVNGACIYCGSMCYGCGL